MVAPETMGEGAKLAPFCGCEPRIQLVDFALPKHLREAIPQRLRLGDGGALRREGGRVRRGHAQ